MRDVNNSKSRQDFTLTISTGEPVLPQGNDFEISIDLSNNTDTSYEIHFNILLWPYIPNWRAFGGALVDPPEYRSRLFQASSILRDLHIIGAKDNTWLLGADLDRGDHYLRFKAMFLLNYHQDNQVHIEIWSNALILTVH